MQNCPSRLGSLRLPFLPWVSRLLLLSSEALGSKTESVFGSWGSRGVQARGANSALRHRLALRVVCARRRFMLRKVSQEGMMSGLAAP